MSPRKLAAALLGFSALISASAATAQQVIELEPIQIYGDRSTDDAQSTTASVLVVDEVDLSRTNLAQWRDIMDRVPNFGDGDLNESGFTIRGVNSEGLTPGGAGAPVASLYIDGVQQTVEGTRRGFRGTFDVEQVEVYRGPQSTLSGRNALAGAVYLRTKDPEFARSGKVQLTYGENNKQQIGVAFGDALSDTLAYRVSAEWSKKDSDISYPSLEGYDRYDDFKTDDYYTLRGKLLWRPSGATDVILSYSHSFDGPAYNNIIGPGWFGLGIEYDDMRGDDWGVLEPLSPGAITYQEIRETTVDNLGLEVKHEFSNGLTFTAQTGLTHSVTGRHSINEGTPGEMYWVDGEFDQTILSQEFRLNYDDGGLRWVAGLYAAKERTEAFRDTWMFGSVTENENTIDVTNTALFGEVSYEFAPGWRVIAGGRLDHYSQEQEASSGGTAAPSTSYEATEFIPKLGLTWEIDSRQQLSLIYQQGYRPGGASYQISSGTLREYEAEQAHNIELNYRGTLMDDRLTVGASLFYQDWDNQQVEILETPGDSTSYYITNAGKSVSYGAELELAYAASDNLDLYGSVGLLHTEFKDFAINTTDYSGKPFPLAPETTITLGFNWRQGDVGWFGGAQATYVGERMSRIENGVADPAMLDAYTVADASLGYKWDNGMSLTGYATNLFDERFYQYEYVEGGQGASAWLGERREIGVRFDYTF